MSRNLLLYLNSYNLTFYIHSSIISEKELQPHAGHEVLKRLISGEFVRMDIIVIARICDYLNCSMNDLVKYVPNKK